MKPLLLLVAFLATACATKSSKAVIRTVEAKPAGRTLTTSEVRAIRRPEIVKAYPLGRYVDPGGRRIMHEAHTIYRVEAAPKWNLAGRGGPTGPNSSATSASELSRNELLVELNRQKEATKAVMQSGRTVSSKLSELTDALQRNRTLSEQNSTIEKDLQNTRARLETLEQELRERPASGPEIKPALKDDPW